MTIRRKLSFIISGLLTVLFLFASAIILYMDAEFREEEFKKRLEEKALTSVKLLIDVKEVDKTLLKIIDQNTVHKLFNEKTLIFDEHFRLIYSSLDDTQIKWRINDLYYLKRKGSFFRDDSNNELLGIYYKTKGKSYYVLISASDIYGKRQLEFLTILLIITFLIFTISGWILTIYMVKKGLKPLDDFHSNISKINESNLEQRLQIQQNSENEIDLIGNEFNLMLQRIEKAYQKQREFTAQASHELKTPIARIIAQLENITANVNDEQKTQILNVISNAVDLNELIQSLLLLTNLDNRPKFEQHQIRIDAIIDTTIEKVCKQYADFKIHYSIEPKEIIYELLSIKSDAKLLEIVFINLFKNAYLYSENKELSVHISEMNQKLIITLSNDGIVLSSAEQLHIFEPFVRGQNSGNNAGLGLGLRIIERILTHYHFQISYRIINNKNCFELRF